MSQPAWSSYWQSGARRGCLPGASDAVQQALSDAWQGFAARLPRDAQMLDLACGAGAVLEIIGVARSDLVLTGVDSADIPALAGLQLMPGVDCAALPFLDGQFAGVTSQFGVEYCPPEALVEAARVLAPDGLLQFVIHSADSRAILHNGARLAAMRALEAAGLFRVARQAVAGFRDPALAAAVATARALHRDQGIASELPLALEQARTSPRPLDRIATIETRAKGEIQRLTAMAAAALDAKGIALLQARLKATGVVAAAQALNVRGEGSMGWIVTGRKMGV